jgi:hypothetical protein
MAWIYPGSACYKNEGLGIAIDFPETWLDKIILIEHNDQPAPALTVYFREALEENPKLGTSAAALFSIVSAHKNDEAAIRRLDDPERFTFLKERGDNLYYFSNTEGGSGGIEMYFNDIWKQNEALLNEMKASILGNFIDRVEILD